ncbi:leucine-rich repeat serine/threonine-protein kinase 1 isoform X2 [Nothobranchius furzeri]|uniref:leucine-rich repeat serine/threonine-protein kinase 1 isoform X2 n=1 Tax=Nothobranchius furzeri TaxID=105023 RepID=UPI003904C725
MSYWYIGDSENTGKPASDLEQQSDTGEKTGTKAPLVEVPGPISNPIYSVNVENIEAAYEDGDEEAARELIQQACCVKCSSGFQPDGLRLLSVASLHGDLRSICYLLKEAHIPVPQEPSSNNPAMLAAFHGHTSLLKELLDTIPGVCLKRDFVNCLLITSCQRGHLDVVRLLVHGYNADVRDFATHDNEFAVITRQPLYAAAKASNEEMAHFLLDNGAGFSSYTLIDFPDFSKQLLKNKIQESSSSSEDEAVGVYWSGLQLPFLELDWFLDVCSQITHLDLSSNSLATLPSVVPWGLIRLRNLDLSNNTLKELPFAENSQDVICSRLQQINLHQNQLTSLPSGLLHLIDLQRLCASKNQLTVLFDISSTVNWIGLRKLEELDVSDNCLSSLPISVMHCLKSLGTLKVCRNKLRTFPDPWACPLKCCKASSNLLENLPDAISMSWRTQLQEVDFSENSLEELPSYIFELEAIIILRLCGNLISSLPAPNKWKCSKLKILDLSRNQLGKTDEEPKSRRLAFLTAWNRKDPDPVCPIVFPSILRDSLEVLTLNHNQLECVPQSVCALHSLTELDLSNNPGIRELPAELGLLPNLWHLEIEELNITNVPQAIRNEGSASVLTFLRAHLRKAEPCRQLKMLVIGPPRQGKTALVEALLTGRSSPFTPAECCISTFIWELDKGNTSKNNGSAVFSVWDVGGPASMTTVNQCFFTDKALYVVIWNLALGEEAVSDLQTWLLNIEARAPNSAVVVVGTHLDLIDTNFRTERLATLRAYVLALCRSPSGARAVGYPDITCKNLHEVSCKTLEGLDDLKTLLFHTALSMKDSSSSACGGKLLGRLIPRSYFLLQEALVAQKKRRNAEREVQYLTDIQLDHIIEQISESDITEYEDKQTAISFLIETGTLLHFPDTSHGLCTLYFLCPVWLSDCLERIICLRSSQPMARNGVIQAKDLKVLEGTGFTQQTQEQYFQFLAKFEIALPLGNNSYLLPHLLPPKPAMDIHNIHRSTTNTLQRVFKMSFVPAGFWERFIARMLISLAEMDLQFSYPSIKTAKSKHHSQSAIYSFVGHEKKSRCSTFRVRRSQTIYWKEGLLVTFDGGYFSVESSEVNWKRTKSGGMKIICQSDTRDFSAMAFITDHVKSLIEQWFPALTASETDGSLLMEQYVPCPLCTSQNLQKQQELFSAEPNKVMEQDMHGETGRGGKAAGAHYFNMEDCVLAAMEKEHITCPLHPDHLVFLKELVPELLMTDFPARLFLEKSKLELSAETENIIGQGGSGTTIYKARYDGQPVAVKHFNFKKCQQLISDTGTMIKHLQSANACRSFSEFRQEASMLHSLHHPCIVSLVGISIHPLCFALQLAPLGSLNTVLEEKRKDKSSAYMPLGHMLTFKVAYQIAMGLAYLHRKNIIFCDLKSDNILVWSLEVQDLVNVKLSDYGISRHSFREGALGVEGTPGYQAPEVRPGIVYDEKVDMFSYGMVIYELLSGRRPALGDHQLQTAKKLSKGIRPVLGGLEQIQFHSLHTLMTSCWDTKPEKRPGAMQCVRLMQEPSFACLRYLLSCDSHSQLFLSQLQGSSAVFWHGNNEDRTYSVVNVENGQMEVKRMSCPGSRISCQMKIQNTLWMSTEEQEMFIYSLKDMCPLSQPQKQFSCPAVITCLFYVPARAQGLAKVFAGMSDGLVAVFNLVDDLPLEGETYLCSHSLNKTVFGLKDSDLRQRPFPVRSMALVSSGSQLWFSNGPGLLVVDSLSLQAIRRLEPYKPPSSIVSIATSFCLWGEEAVWTLDDHTNTLLLFHAASYQLCATYYCGHIDPIRDVFPVQHPAGIAMAAADGVTTKNQETDAEGTHKGVTVIHSEGAGIQIIQHQDFLADYCSLDPPELDSDYLLNCGGHVLLPANVGGSSSDQDQQRTTSTAETPLLLQAFTLLPVHGTLWIPRRGGDVMIINMQSHQNQLKGCVAAVLSPPGLSTLGTLEEAALVANNTIVCGFQKSSEWSLVVWRAWGCCELEVFYHSWEKLGHLEAGMRRRR